MKTQEAERCFGRICEGVQAPKPWRNQSLPLENSLPESSGSFKIGQFMPRHSFIFINQSMSFTTGELMAPESGAGRQRQEFPARFWACTEIPPGLFGLIPFHSLSPSPLCPRERGADL